MYLFCFYLILYLAYMGFRLWHHVHIKGLKCWIRETKKHKREFNEWIYYRQEFIPFILYHFWVMYVKTDSENDLPDHKETLRPPPDMLIERQMDLWTVQTRSPAISIIFNQKSFLLYLKTYIIWYKKDGPFKLTRINGKQIAMFYNRQTMLIANKNFICVGWKNWCRERFGRHRKRKASASAVVHCKS